MAKETKVNVAAAGSGQPIWIKNLDSKCAHCGGAFDSGSDELVQALNESGEAEPFLLRFPCPECGQSTYPVHVGNVPRSGFDVLNNRVQTHLIEGVVLGNQSSGKRFISV